MKKSNFLRKGLVFGIAILFIGLSSFLSVSGNENLNEQLDQYQTQCNDGLATAWLAQSFKPTLNILTSVSLAGWRDGNPQRSLWVSIKEDLNGEYLTRTYVPESSIPIHTHPFVLKWTKFDFPDIAVEPEKSYYIIWHIQTHTDNDWVGWYSCSDDVYERGRSWFSFDESSWELLSGDFCFKTYGYDGANLNCNGDLRWTDVKIESTVSGNFTVENIGGPGTELDWEISEYPSWGTWTFTPNSGNDLTPEDGPFTVQVSVIAPYEDSLELYGNIIIRNKDFPSTDRELLSTSLIEINNPPDIPTIDGVTSGRIRERYTYRCSALDPEGKDVYYYIEWGDGSNISWIGPYASGEEATVTHLWSTQGTYSIKVKARDRYGAESDWSDPLSVTMPKNKAVNIPFLQFLQLHPLIYQLIQRLLKL